jgi:hypothetical protein
MRGPLRARRRIAIGCDAKQPEYAMHPAAQPQGRASTYPHKQQEAGNGISAITCLSRF